MRSLGQMGDIWRQLKVQEKWETFGDNEEFQDKWETFGDNEEFRTNERHLETIKSLGQMGDIWRQ